MTANTLIAGLLFGSIGFVAFVFGKRNGLWKPAVIGILLMAYPYFVSDTLPLYVIGAVLTIALFFVRE